MAADNTTAKKRGQAGKWIAQSREHLWRSYHLAFSVQLEMKDVPVLGRPVGVRQRGRAQGRGLAPPAASHWAKTNPAFPLRLQVGCSGDGCWCEIGSCGLSTCAVVRESLPSAEQLCPKSFARCCCCLRRWPAIYRLISRHPNYPCQN